MNDWYQQHLTPPQVIEVNIRIGLVPEGKHAQAMVELTDPTTGILVAQWSNPHVHSDNWLDLIDQAASKAAEMVAVAHEPF